VKQLREAHELIGRNPQLSDLVDVAERARRTVDRLSAPRPADRP